MIAKQDILDRAGEWQLRADVVEKDYVLGWLLIAIGQHRRTSATWVFKGGTCLRKCYFETYRFSEDLDFSLTGDAVYTEARILRILREIAAEAAGLSGIDFPADATSVRERKDKLGRVIFQGRIGYRGPLAVPSIPRILLDLTRHEPILDSIHSRVMYHPYPDAPADDRAVGAYSLDELFAEKTRALYERTRPRDLYDVIYIGENRPDALDLPRVCQFFHDKCRAKGIAFVTTEKLLARIHEEPELVSEWSNMLAHQLPQLPPLDSLLARLPALLGWVDVPAPVPQPAPVAAMAADHASIAPSGIRLWGTAIPLEVVRFAGANRLMIEFSYHGKHRIAEPYSLRRAATGNLLLYAWEQDATHIKAFNVADVTALRATNLPFTPRYRVEFTGTGPLSIHQVSPRSSGATRLSVTPTRSPRRSRGSRPGPTYVFECMYCGKKFRHRTNNSRLRKHKSAGGYGTCPGRRGHLVKVE